MKLQVIKCATAGNYQPLSPSNGGMEIPPTSEVSSGQTERHYAIRMHECQSSGVPRRLSN